MSPPATAPGLAHRLGAILAGLRQVLAAHAGRHRTSAPMALLLWNRLNHTLGAVAALVARYHAGTLRRALSRRTPPTGQRRPPRHTLPRGRAWLVRGVPGGAVHGLYLRQLLDDPELAAIADAAPQLRRLLRPLWHMLLVEPTPPLLQPDRTRNPAPRHAQRPSRRRTRPRARTPAAIDWRDCLPVGYRLPRFA